MFCEDRGVDQRMEVVRDIAEHASSHTEDATSHLDDHVQNAT